MNVSSTNISLKIVRWLNLSIVSSDVDPGCLFILDIPSTSTNCSQKLDSLFLVIDALIGVLILAGNLFTCAVLIFGGNLCRGASFMNVFLLSLSVSDVLLALIIIPSYSMYCAGCTMSEMCWMFEGGKDFTFLASVFNLSAISYDRFLAVFQPLLYNLKMTSKRVLLILLVIWLLPIMLAALRNIWQHMENPALATHINITYTYVLLFVFVITPIVTVTVVNIRIILAIKKQSRKISGSSNGRGALKSLSVMFRNDSYEARRRRGTLSCVLVVALFVVCWLPRASYYFLRLTGRPELDSLLLKKLSVTFLLFQSSLNPVIYSFYRREFRQMAKKLLRSCGW